MNVHLRMVSAAALEDAQATGSFVFGYKYNIAFFVPRCCTLTVGI
jgi:hypothetical protein